MTVSYILFPIVRTDRMQEHMSETEIIKETIEELRPFINMEGGDIEFIKYDEESKTVYVKMLGACAMCAFQDDTLEMGLLEALKEKVPKIENIVNTPL